MTHEILYKIKSLGKDDENIIEEMLNYYSALNLQSITQQQAEYFYAKKLRDVKLGSRD